MIEVPPAIKSFQFNAAHPWCLCYRIERVTDGQVFRYTNADHELTAMTAKEWDEPVFETFTPAHGPSSENWRKESGTKGSTGGLFGVLEDGQLADEDFRVGLFDGAILDVYGINWRYPWAGRLFHERYWFGDITWTGSSHQIELENLWSRLNRDDGRKAGRNCDVRELGDERCGVDTTLMQEVATVQSVTQGKNRVKFQTTVTQPDGYYSVGHLTWLTGNNAIQGVNRFAVKKYRVNNGEVTLFVPTHYDVQPGDQFRIVRGCARNFIKNCKKDFSNQRRFRGFPHMQGADKLVKTPNAKD